MTQKELLYLEDAIGHEKNIVSIIEQTIKTIENADLKTFLEAEKTCHQKTYDNLINTLKVKNNA